MWEIGLRHLLLYILCGTYFQCTYKQSKIRHYSLNTQHDHLGVAICEPAYLIWEVHSPLKLICETCLWHFYSFNFLQFSRHVSIIHTYTQAKNIWGGVFFPSFPLKSDTNYLVEWMKLNFYDYRGFQLKITHSKHFRPECTSLFCRALFECYMILWGQWSFWNGFVLQSVYFPWFFRLVANRSKYWLTAIA